jgi:hypothetical protein
MVCYLCHGQRLMVVQGRLQLCTECGGLGVLHCCEGDQAQPEPVAEHRETLVPDERPVVPGFWGNPVDRCLPAP